MTKSILSEQREADEALCEALEGLARDCRLSYGWEDTAPDCERAIARIRALSEALQEACHERDGLLAEAERVGKRQLSDPTKRMARILGAVWVERDFPSGEKS